MSVFYFFIKSGHLIIKKTDPNVPELKETNMQDAKSFIQLTNFFISNNKKAYPGDFSASYNKINIGLKLQHIAKLKKHNEISLKKFEKIKLRLIQRRHL